MIKSKYLATGIGAYLAYIIVGALISIIGSNIFILSSHFAVDTPTVNYLFSAIAIGRISTLLISGVLADKFGRKKIIIVSMLLLIVFYSLLPFTYNFTIAFLLSVLAGMGYGMVESSATALLFDSFSDDADFAVSIMQAFFCTGAISTPIITGILMNREIYWGWLFWGIAIFTFCVMVFLAVKKFPPISKKSKSSKLESTEGYVKYKIEPLPMREGLTVALIVLFYSLSTSTLTTLSSIHGNEVIGLSESGSIQLLTMYNIGCITGTLLIARLLKKFHQTVFIIFNTTVMLVVVIFYVTLKNPATAFGIYIILGAAAGIFYSLCLTVVGDMFPKNKGTATGALLSLSALGGIAAPFISSLLIHLAGMDVAFNILIITLGITLAGAVIFRIRYKKITK